MATSLIKPCIDNPRFNGHFIPNPSTERGNNFHLGVHPKQSNKIIYPSGKFIVVRDLNDPAGGFVYRGHNSVVTVAKFSPSGCWVASGDSSGKVRVWSWDSPEHNLKVEINAIAGAVKDLAWDSESKRIVAVGQGGVNMRVFTWDTGNNLGTMVGHAKNVTSCDYRPCRPFKLMTGSEDMRTIFFKGPPFTMEHSNKDEHSNFINIVRFSPDGALIATAGSDYKVWLYDGNAGNPIAELPSEHKGSVYSLDWTADSQRIITSSADKTCRLWNVANRTVEQVWTFSDSPEVGDMQCACACVADGSFVSVSIRGDISILKPGDERPVKVITAHKVAITAMCTSTINECLVTGSFDGVVMLWSRDGTGTRLKGQLGNKTIIGAAHSNKISGIAVSAAGIVSVGWDDMLRIASASSYEYTDSVSLSGQPCGISANANSDLAAVATNNVIAMYNKTQLVAELAVSYTAKSIALLGETEVAVGAENGTVYVYNFASNSFGQPTLITGHRGSVTTLSYSPDGLYLAVGDSAREVTVWERVGGGFEPKVQGLWQFHTSTVNCLAWCPDSRLLATGGPDETVYVWSVDTPRKRISYPFANREGVTGLCWVDENILASAGADHCVAHWNVGEDKGSVFV